MPKDPCSARATIQDLAFQIDRRINHGTGVAAAAAAVVTLTSNVSTMNGRVVALQATRLDLHTRIGILEAAAE